MRGVSNRIEEVLSRYEPVTESGCWIWLGALDGAGYAMVGFHGETRRVHTLSYEHYKGPIPLGLEPDHTCRIKSCINPDHLEAVTHLENIRRGSHVKISRSQVLEIRASNLSCSVLAAQYNVKANQIRRLRSGEQGR